MESSLNEPRFPLYIVSKGRHESRLTSRALERMGVDYRIIVEEQEYADYAAVIEPRKVLVLDKAFQRDYDAVVTLNEGESKGSGPARNFAWEHSLSTGNAWHWVMDDNIRSFFRLHCNTKSYVETGSFWRAMEDFCLRYENVAMAGPNYEFFVPRKDKCPAFIPNTRIFSCNLIRNDMPFRWRCRYNEDADLSLRMLKAGYCTIQFNAFLQKKMPTQSMKGGNTAEIYADGTLRKTQALIQMHPDVTRMVYKFGRIHHHVDYRPFRANKLIRKPDAEIATGNNEYGMIYQPFSPTAKSPTL